MELILPGLDFTDWIPAIIIALIGALCVWAALWEDDLGAASFAFLVFGLVSFFALFGGQSVHMGNQKADFQEKFAEAYDLTIIDGTLPFNEDDTPEALVVYLNEVPGEQTILVDLVDGHYEVTHNGNERTVQND